MKKTILSLLIVPLLLTSISFSSEFEHDMALAADLYKDGKFKQSQEAYNKINTNESMYNEGNCFFRLKSYSLAKDTYKRTIKKTDRLNEKELLFKTYFNLGNTYVFLAEIEEEKGDSSNQIDYLFKAKDSFKEALFIDKEDEDTLINFKIVQDKLSLKDIK